MPKHIKASGRDPGGQRTRRSGAIQRAAMSEDPLLINYLLILRFGGSEPG